SMGPRWVWRSARVKARRARLFGYVNLMVETRGSDSPARAGRRGWGSTTWGRGTPRNALKNVGGMSTDAYDCLRMSTRKGSASCDKHEARSSAIRGVNVDAC